MNKRILILLFTAFFCITQNYAQQLLTGGTAKDTLTYSGTSAAGAFDGDISNSGWMTTSASSWLEYAFTNPKIVGSYAIISSSLQYNSLSYTPKTWNLQGFNGVSWVNLDTVKNQLVPLDEWTYFTVSNTVAYQKYRIKFTASQGGSYLFVTELRLFSNTITNKPYSGTYSIGTTGKFKKIQEAVDSLTKYGVSGAVELKLKSGFYAEQVTINDIIGASAVNTITFTSESGNPTDVTWYFTSENNASTNFVVKINSASYLTFSKIGFRNASTTTNCNIVTLSGKSRNIAFNENIFNGGSSTNAATASHIYSNGNIIDSLVINKNNFISNASALILGSNSTYRSSQIYILNNNITSARAIELNYVDSSFIQNNTITNSTIDNVIYLSSVGAFSIERNTIKSTVGLRLLAISSQVLTKGFSRYITNNIFDCSGGYDNVSISSVDSVKIFNNTILKSGTYSCLNIYSCKGVFVANNFLHNNAGIAFQSDNSTFSLLDYNNYFSVSPDLVKWNSSNNFKTIDEFKSAVPLYNQNSTQVNATIGLTSDGHFNTKWLDGTGLILPEITKDILGKQRSSKPDIGVYEFTATTGNPLNGNLIVNNLKGPYKTLKAVTDSLMSCGIDGKTTILLEDDAYEEQILLKKIPGLNQNNTLTIASSPKRKTKAALAYTAAGTSDNYVMHIYGLDNITFKNIMFYAGSTSYSNGLILNGYCRKIVIDSCEFQTNTTSNSGNRIHIADGGELVSDSIIVKNTLFNNNYQAIRLSSYSNNGQRYCNYIELSNNTMISQFIAADIENCKKLKIYKNAINNFNYQGLYLNKIIEDFDISQNVIKSSDASGNYGFQLNNSGGVFGNNGLISNNIIDVKSYNNSLYLNAVTNVDVLSNTLILLSSPYPYSDHVPLYIYGGSTISVKNNILYAPTYNNVFNYTAPSGIVVSDYNAYYNLSTTLGTWGTSSVANLSDLQTTQKSDLHSVFANPGFVSDSMRIPTSFNLDNDGITEPLCINDIVDSIRSSKPDIGAYEFTSSTKPLHGIYYIQKDTGDFKTITDAANALNSLGIDASVRFKIAGGTYYDTFTLLPIAGSSASDTIVFEPASADTVRLITNEKSQSYLNNYYGIKLNSASNISFKSLCFTAKLVNQSTIAIGMFGSSKNVHFSNCIFNLDKTTSSIYTFGIYALNTHPYYENISIKNCSFNNGDRPIYFDCNAGQGNNFEITGNKIFGCRYDAIWLRNINGITIKNNELNEIKHTGIYIESSGKPISISKNKITNSFNSESGTYGISLNTCGGSFIGRIVLSNNTISNINGFVSTSYGFNGISLVNCQFVDVFYNSILINRQSTSGTSYSLYASAGNYLRIRNNILSNYHTIGYALYVSSGSIIDACDYNNLYTEGSSKFSYWGTDYATLNALKLASSYNVTSISSPTNFFSFTDLHTASNAIIGKALPISSIDTDQDGDPRDATTPDIGADEVFCTKATLDLKIPKICLGSPLTFADSSLNVSAGTKYSWDFQNDGSYDLTTVYNSKNNSIEPISYGFSTAGGTSYSQTSNSWGAFDGDSLLRGWACNTSNNPVWLQFKPMNSTIVNKYSIFCSSKQNDNYTSSGYNPKTWILQASNDGTTWTNLDNQTNVVVKNDSLYQFSISNTTSYTYYRLYITAMQSGTTYLRITELSLYEASGISSKVNFKYPSAGNYTLKLKATQIAGCLDSTTFPITVDGNVPTADAGNDESICQGLTKTLVGNGNGTYSWSTGESTKQIDVKPTTIGTANYYLTVTANTGCTAVDSVKLNVVAPFKYIRPISDTICLGQSAILKVSGAKSYIWNTGKDTATLVVNPTTTTKYKVQISDGNCVIPDSATVTVVSLKAKIDSLKQVDCNSQCNGYLKAGVSDGFAPYKYQWSSKQTTNEISSLCAGTYSVTVKDVTGCIDSVKTTIVSPEPITASFVVTPTQCKVNDGTATITAKGGNGGFSYVWKSDIGATYKALANGNYSVTAIDSKLCQASFDVTVPKMPNPEVQVQSKNVNCFDGNDGSITINILSSTGTPTAFWNTKDNGLTIENLKSGTYSANITDTAGCSVSISQIISQPKKMTYSKSANTTICKNASVSLFAAGGSQYKWSNNSSNPINLVSPKNETKYFVTISDGICQVTDSVFVSIDDVTASTTKIDAGCFGSQDGSISVIAGKGLKPFNYSWNIPTSNQNESSISNLTPGTYIVTVTDGLHCSTQVSTQVNEPEPLNAVLTLQNTKCDIADGYVKVQVNGGTSPYTYLWNTGSTKDSIGGLDAGIYSVTIKDKNGCSVDKTISVNTLNAPQIIIESIKSPSCYGFNDGQILVSGNDGSGSYSFAWSNGSSTKIITDLSSGSYTLTLSDSKACKSIQTIVLNQPSPLTVVPEITSPGCSLSNGSVLLNCNGGTKPYTIKWENASNSLYLQNVTAGVYRAVVTDINGCSKKVQANVNDLNAPKVDILNVININCSGTGGAIYTAISGGTGNLSIQWSDGSNDKDLKGVAQGFYSLMVSDANNCRGTNGAQVDGQVPNASAGSDKKICAGDSVVLIATGGNTFLWNNGTKTNSIKVSPSANTNYKVTVSNGTCSKIAEVMVYVSNITAKVVGKNDATCFGLCNASATVLASGGIAPYNYHWSSGLHTSTGFASGLCAGQHTIEVTDAYACKAQTSVTIAEPKEMLISFDTSSSNCSQATGRVKAIVTGGVSPYQYQWANGSKKDTLTALYSGSYLLRVKDGNGCEASNLATINDKGSATLSFNKTNPSCYGFSNGKIDMTISQGISPYIISWSNGKTTEDISDLQIGPYNVEVNDSKGCKSTGIVILTQPVALSFTAQVSPSTCSGSDGQVNLVAKGGTPSYSFVWDDNNTSSTKIGLASGIYQATVTDANACKASLLFSVGDKGAPYTIIDSISPEHCGQNDGSVSIQLISSAGISSYKWSNGTQLPNLKNVSAGSYYVVVSDINNCKSFMPALVPVAKPETPQICMVTVGSKGKNLVVWDRYANNNIQSYNIYKETFSKNIYQLIGSNLVTQNGVFEDENSYPVVRSYRYRISSVDQCGNESDLSLPHKTMHLTQSVGYQQNTVNLVWDEYQGVNYGTINIYRGSKPDTLDLLTSIAAGNFTYTDTPPAGHFYYQVGMQMPYVCDPTLLKSDNGPFSVSLSNMAESELVDAPIFSSENSVNISPNPASDFVSVTINSNQAGKYELELIALDGRKVFQEEGFLGSVHTSRINIESFASGMYFVKIHAGNSVYNEKFVKGNR